MSATAHTPTLGSAAANVDVTEVPETEVVECGIDGERVIDFDLDANVDYEIGSSVVVDGDNRVVEAVVRFGRVEDRPELGIGGSIVGNAFQTAAREATGFDSFEGAALEAGTGHFRQTVPHLRVLPESIDDYGAATLTLDEFAAAVDELAAFVDDVLRGDAETVDAEIDEYL